MKKIKRHAKNRKRIIEQKIKKRQKLERKMRNNSKKINREMKIGS